MVVNTASTQEAHGRSEHQRSTSVKGTTMNVTSATSTSTIDTQLSVGAGTNNIPAPTSDGLGAPATTNFSGPGRMFQQLSDLSKSDPTKFKQVMSDMASSLRADAQNATGDQA